MYLNKKIGSKGEKIAVDFLKLHNYTIIEKNFFCRQGEIDIIAKDNIKGELVFLEVKTRTSNIYGNGSEAVNKIKQRHIYQCARYFVYKNNIYNIPIRFDVIEIRLHGDMYWINHIKSAFWIN